jgi:hypothetical protein
LIFKLYVNWVPTLLDPTRFQLCGSVPKP